MSRTIQTVFTAALLLVPFASAQTPAAPPVAQVPGAAPVGWTNAALATASYALHEPVWEGGTGLVSEEQRQGILRAMKNDSGQAITRRYPAVRWVAPGTPGAVKVTPVIVAPGALLPWATLGVRLDLELPTGSRVSLRENFSLLTLWQQGPQAANYAYDQLARQLP
ncbi:hypothetical protein SAMN04488058_11445 [Deinococcus reticulitermitis]|uniref:Uncharacterized protein n=1 Tax=Deinococcus reticulitermitis TaxID=856736 RepID=A0A1H7AWZ4_9DEIO|nr:hypothetical protein [Deinococcus reticulitermitis]SEJ68437.1 hypothetical protein SAMN04488058_11445 [Deinococcus reticulitermitis]